MAQAHTHCNFSSIQSILLWPYIHNINPKRSLDFQSVYILFSKNYLECVVVFLLHVEYVYVQSMYLLKLTCELDVGERGEKKMKVLKLFFIIFGRCCFCCTFFCGVLCGNCGRFTRWCISLFGRLSSFANRCF